MLTRRYRLLGETCVHIFLVIAMTSSRAHARLRIRSARASPRKQYAGHGLPTARCAERCNSSSRRTRTRWVRMVAPLRVTAGQSDAWSRCSLRARRVAVQRSGGVRISLRVRAALSQPLFLCSAHAQPRRRAQLRRMRRARVRTRPARRRVTSSMPVHSCARSGAYPTLNTRGPGIHRSPSS